MAATNYTVKYGQNLFDLVLQLYGDTSGIGDFLTQNPGLDFGYSPNIGDVVVYEPNNAINSTIVDHFKENGIVVSNGVGNVYFKTTNEPIKMVMYSDAENLSFSFTVSGFGDMYIDWGDNSGLEQITLSETQKNVTHSVDLFLPEDVSSRKIRIYGDFSFDFLDISKSSISDVYVVDSFNIGEFIISDNNKLTNIGAANIIQDIVTLESSNIKIESLTPMISQESLRGLWINDGNINQDVLDDYFIGLVKNYQSRPSCHVRMWGNSSPSGLYQRPEVLYDPQSGLEAIWVLENERGWKIEEIISPPLEQMIVRRFQERESNVIVDSINNSHALLKLPVSSFTSDDHSYIKLIINAASVNRISFKIIVESNPASEQTIIGAKDNVNDTNFKISIKDTGHVEFYHGSNSFRTDFSIADGNTHTISIDNEDLGGMRCYIDDTELSQLPAVTGFIYSLIYAGAYVDSDGVISEYVDCLLWDIDIDNGRHFIPLPHLGWDTIIGRKYEIYSIGANFIGTSDGQLVGSDHMQKYGAVSRSTNLSESGYAEKIGDGSLNEFWSEDIVSGSVKLAEKTLNVSFLAKINQEAYDNSVSVRVSIESYDSQDILLGSDEISSSALSYEGVSFNSTIPANSNRVTIRAFHNPDSEQLGNVYIKEVYIKDMEPEYIPNNNSGTQLLPLLSGDELILGSDFLNNTPMKIDFQGGDTQIGEYIFDKSRTDIWDDEVRSSSHYLASNPRLWDREEISQTYRINHVLLAFADMTWVKMDSGVVSDIFIYPASMFGDYKLRCSRYAK